MATLTRRREQRRKGADEHLCRQLCFCGPERMGDRNRTSTSYQALTTSGTTVMVGGMSAAACSPGDRSRWRWTTTCNGSPMTPDHLSDHRQRALLTVILGNAQLLQRWVTRTTSLPEPERAAVEGQVTDLLRAAETLRTDQQPAPRSRDGSS